MATIAYEKWIRADYSHICQAFAKDEIDKLNEMSLSADVQNICQQQLDSVADVFRGSWISKGFTIDVRPHYIPNGYLTYVLNYARVYIAARFPGSKEIFIDEIREKLFEEAQEVLKEGYIGVPLPDYSDDPELSGKTFDAEDSAITLPWQRLISVPGSYGYAHPYIADYQTSSLF